MLATVRRSQNSGSRDCSLQLGSECGTAVWTYPSYAGGRLGRGGALGSGEGGLSSSKQAAKLQLSTTNESCLLRDAQAEYNC